MTTDNTDLAVTDKHAEIRTAGTNAVEEVSLTTQLAYAAELAKSGMIPEAFRKRPENVLVAVEWGRELGLGPIAAMKEIYVVHGTPALSSKSMLMLARRAGHRVRVTAADEQQATCEIVRHDDPEFPHRVTYTLEDAKRAGLLSSTGWKNDPKTMLRWRAIANCVRLACPEVLGGISYTPDEIEENRRRNSSSVTVTQIVDSTETHSQAVSRLMKSLSLTGNQLRDFTSRALGKKATAWEKLSDDEQARIVAALTEWDNTGTDPTAPDDYAEVIDPDTGEVQQ